MPIAEALPRLLDTLAPVFLLVGLGAWLAWRGVLDPPLARGLGRLVFWVGLPALLFGKVATAAWPAVEALKVLAVILGGMAAGTLAGAALILLLRVERPARGAFLQACFRCNMAFVGLPVLYYALGEENEAALQLAALMIAPVIPAVTIGSVLVLGDADAPRPTPLVIARKLATNPLILACLAGLPFCYFGIGLPLFVTRSATALGRMGLPLALLGIGAALVRLGLGGRARLAWLAALVNVAVLPLAGWPLCRALGLSGEETLIALTFLACPVAASSHILVLELGGDEGLAGGAVVTSTLASAISLGAVILLFG